MKRTNYIQRSWRWTLIMASSAATALAGTLFSDLSGTFQTPLEGWVYDVEGGYDKGAGALKLTEKGPSVTTELYPGAVTNLTIEVEGNSISTNQSTLAVYLSSDGLIFGETPVKTWILSDKRTLLQLSLPESTGGIRFKLHYHKVKGNLALYSVKAAYSDAGMPVPPLSPQGLGTRNISEKGFTATWEGSFGATDYLLTVTRYTGKRPSTVEEGFDTLPERAPEGWLLALATDDRVYTSASYCGKKSPALKFSESGQRIQTPVFGEPIVGLSFQTKGYKAGSTFLVEGLASGESWRAEKEVTLPLEKKVTTLAFDPASDYRSLRLTFTKVGNVGVDDLLLSLAGTLEGSAVLTSRSTSGATSYALTNLVGGLYGFTLQAQNGKGCSPRSEELFVEVGRRPPLLTLPDGPFSVRVGERVRIPLTITETDGDPVLEIRGVCETVSGPYSLEKDLLAYEPIPSDIGSHRFLLTATDRDGTSPPLSLEIQVKPAQVKAIPIQSPEGSYQEDFNGYVESGERVWDGGALPFPAWYAYLGEEEVTTFRTGGAGSGIWLMEGTTNDWALGSQAGNDKRICYGISLTNETDRTINRFEIAYLAGQRYASSERTNLLEVCYRLSKSVAPLNRGGWRRIPSLCFESPEVLLPGERGRRVEQIEPRSAVLDLPLPPGGVLSLCWSDEDDKGSDHRFTVDNLSLSWEELNRPFEEGCEILKEGGGEDFSSVRPAPQTPLPWGWRVGTNSRIRTTGSYAEGRTSLDYGSVPGSSSSSSGSYAFRSGPLLDSAVGALPGKEVQSISLIGRFVNRTGFPCSRWSVDYALEKYRCAGEATRVTLLFSMDGTVWGEIGSTSMEPDGIVGNLPDPPPQGSRRSVRQQVAPGHAIPVDGSFYLAWQFSGEGSSVAAPLQAIGIDDLRICPELPTGTVLMVR